MKKTLLIAAICCSSFFAQAQSWTQIQDSLFNGVYPEIWSKGSFGFLVSDYYHIFRMNTYSQPWQNAMNGIPYPQREFNGLAISNDTAYALTYFGNLYQSVDGGDNWNQLPINGIPLSYFDPQFYSVGLHAIPGKLFLNFSNDSCYSSTDGSNWTFFNRYSSIGKFYENGIGIWTSSSRDSLIVYDVQNQPIDTAYFDASFPFSVLVNCFSTDNQYEYGYSPDDSTIYRIDLTRPAQPAIQYGFILPDSTLINTSASYHIAGKFQTLDWLYVSPTGHASHIVYFSADSGQTWSLRNDMKWFVNFVPFTANNDSLLATDGIYNKVRFSADSGTNWSALQTQINGLNYDNLVASTNLDTLIWLYSVNTGSPLYLGMVRSTDGGNSWQIANNGLPIYPYYDADSTLSTYHLMYLYKAGGAVFTIANDYSLYKTVDAGTSWQQVTLPPSGLETNLIGSDENSLFISRYHYLADTFSYFRTDDYGLNWIHFNVPTGDTTGYNRPSRIQITGKNDTLLLRYNQYIYQSPIDHFHYYYSVDNGIQWTEITPPQTISNANKRPDVNDDILPVKSGMAFGSRANMFIQIVETTDSSSWLAYNSPTVYYDSLYLYDSGNWTVINHSGLPADIDMQSLSYDNGTWYLSSDYGVFASTDDGLNWGSSLRQSPGNYQPLANGLDEGMKMYNLKSYNGNLVSGTRGSGIWKYDPQPLQITNEISSEHPLNVYPVPANNGIIFWQSPVALQIPVMRILDLQGRVIMQQTVSSGTTGSVEIHSLANGIYLLEMNDGGKISRTEFVVSN